MNVGNPTKLIALCLLTSACVTYAGIELGDNSSVYANDGECDDPRFTGGGMADSLENINILSDATDCAKLLEADLIRPQRTKDQWNPQQCGSISYGSNSSDWAHDGQCDDPRFTGPGTDSILNLEDRLADAADCRALCDAGEIWPK